MGRARGLRMGLNRDLLDDVDDDDEGDGLGDNFSCWLTIAGLSHVANSRLSDSVNSLWWGAMIAHIDATWLAELL